MHARAHALQLPEGDDEATAGNRELANASVIYSIADPGTGVNFMRSALGGGGDDDTSAADEAYERGQVSTMCIQRRDMPSFTWLMLLASGSRTIPVHLRRPLSFSCRLSSPEPCTYCAHGKMTKKPSKRQSGTSGR